MYSVSVIVPSWHYWIDPFKLQPYWEMYYATILQKHFPKDSVSVDLVDLRGIPEDSLTNVVRDIPERDLYLYWIMKSGDAIEVYSIVSLLKDFYPKSIHVAGGTHVEMCAEECATHFDAVVIGPGEELFKKNINDSCSGKLQDIYRQSYKEVPFDDTPFPRRDFVPEDRVINNKLFEQYGDIRSTMLYFSRGCIHKCAFCGYNVPPYLQMRSPKMMRAELKYLKQEYKVKGVLLKDEIAIHPNPRISRQVFEVLGDSDVIWRGQTTTVASYEQLKMARESGCRELAVGIETADMKVMKIVNKEWQTEKQIREFIGNAKKVDIKLKLCFVFGLPGEPKDIVDRTIKFIEETQPEFVALSGFCPAPGSKIFKDPEYYGIKYIDRDWNKHAHLLYRFSNEEEVGLPFEYHEETRWGKSFTRKQIKENIRHTQRWLEERGMTY